ncbi:UDP-N-acetylmuramoyl-L-alanine--D-glutamate ligase [Nocardioides sp.]|uniref:UDP-N-acetylmuramoyl-L-alanine--D-glutamate ligase n=1 Tax=Nocardioides sp. TaxID=35761 RepID=UPI002EDA57DA
MRFEDLAGRDVVIWGTGREGRATYAELGRRGVAATFVLTGDGAVPEDLAPLVSVGPRALERLERADVVVKSPGVPRTAPELARVRELGVAVTSLTDLWLSANAARVVAVTGTKGKSTTSALIRHLLTSTGTPAALVGNGGTPVTDGDTADARVAVAEVSSYQAADLSVSPRVAVVTSLFPEHLPWHGGFDQYVRDKLNLVAHGCEVVVVPDLEGDLAERVRASAGAGTRLVAPGSVGIAVSDSGIDWGAAGRLDAGELRIQGRHNLVNVGLALAAVAVGFEVDGAARAALLEAARTFRPLEHRLEPVPSGDGRLWVDDSLATAPEAVVAALETYPSSRVALILGGADRGLSFAPLRDYLAARPTDAPVSVVAVGPAGARWVAEAGAVTGGAHQAAGFTEALAWIRDDLDGCEVVLLSPGAPSFDEFASYEERSAAFRQAARLARSAG